MGGGCLIAPPQETATAIFGPPIWFQIKRTVETAQRITGAGYPGRPFLRAHSRHQRCVAADCPDLRRAAALEFALVPFSDRQSLPANIQLSTSTADFDPPPLSSTSHPRHRRQLSIARPAKSSTSTRYLRPRLQFSTPDS